MTQEERRAVNILRGYGDPACYEQMVQTIARGMAQVIHAQESGVLIHHTKADLYMLAGNARRMEEMAKDIPLQAEEVLVHGSMPPERVEAIRERFGLASAMPFVLYAYYGGIPPQETELDIRPLGEEAIEFVHAHYGHASREYLLERLREGVMLGAYVEDNAAGFIGEHIEGAMGLLHVLPEYRRHHLGCALERADIRRTMLEGNTPFCQVFPDNQASHNLQERLGMTRARGDLYWITNETD